MFFFRKALFKPGAFFKGFLLPLCEAGNCTLREAVIIGEARMVSYYFGPWSNFKKLFIAMYLRVHIEIRMWANLI